MKKTIRAMPVSTRQAKIDFIRRQAARIHSRKDPAQTVKLIKDLANEMVDAKLYLKSTALSDRCNTVFTIITELGFWEASLCHKVPLRLGRSVSSVCARARRQCR